MAATSRNELETTYGDACFDYTDCTFGFGVCNATTDVDTSYRYSDASAVWVLVCAIIVFFMKAGFLLVELSFARNIREKRRVVVVKHLDVFASAFGFFFIGFDLISHYNSPERIPLRFFALTSPLLWFFKFTFASNAATIVGGCLVTHKYKMRLSAAFISAFVISGVLHPAIARLIWTDHAASYSPYRFCNGIPSAQGYNCTKQPFNQELYILDFAGGGAVHLVGGLAGLVLCLYAKLHKHYMEKKERKKDKELKDKANTSRIFQSTRPEEQEEVEKK